jgi:hypothetical protein
LGQVPNAPSENAQMPAQQPGEGNPKDAPMGGKLLDNVRGENYRFNNEQRSQYNDLINNSIQGVKAKGAY